MNDSDLKMITTSINSRIGERAMAFLQLKHEEDDEFYDVWKVETPQKCYILKRAKGFELEAYTHFFGHAPSYAPKFYGVSKHGEYDYILLEFIRGNNLVHCSREPLRTALDALVKMQSEHWNDATHDKYCLTFKKSLDDRKNRANYLCDPDLEQAYSEFLRIYEGIPCTLCHDDLLPFNVLIDAQNRAVFIDWEVCGCLPYPTSLARLIAHGADDGSSMFLLSPEDREFAIQYYYDALPSKKGISYAEYRQTIEYFLFYEYCEWVYVGNRYGETDGEYFKRYFRIAKAAAQRLLRV